MVIVHNYSEEQRKNLAPDSSKNENIDEDHAYIVGVWVTSVFVILLLVLFVVIAISRSNNNEKMATQVETSKKEQVLGEKKKTSTVVTEPKTEVKTESSTNENVTQLERPLSDEEIVAKAKTISGSNVHTVGSGENLYTIGEKYNIDWREIAEASNLSPPYSLRVGQKLIIPPQGGAR